MPDPSLIDAQIKQIPVAFDRVTGKFSEKQFEDFLASQGLTPREVQSDLTDELAQRHFGYAIAQPQVIREMNKARDSYPCDAISIVAATAALECQGQWRPGCEIDRRLVASACAPDGILHEQMFWELAVDMPVEIRFVCSEEQAYRLLDVVEEAQQSVFYVISPTRYGIAGAEKSEWSDGMPSAN